MSSSKKRTIGTSIVVLLFLAVFVLLSFTRTGTSPVHAKSAIANSACTGNGCDRKSPVTLECAKDAFIAKSANFPGGVVEILFSNSCHAGWGFIKFDKALPSGLFGDAQIARTDGKFLGCSDQGGQGIVRPGGTTCY